VFRFASFEEVSVAYRAAIDRLGVGASRTPACRIFDATGRQTAYVSYNGRVWAHDAADPCGDDALCLYDPRPGPGPGALPPERYHALATVGAA
jgi:hypothetical protein